MKRYNYYLFVICLFFFSILSVNLFSDGMFMDGLIYADIARNLSEELGSYWHLHFTDTFNNEFYGHPPLVFWIQSWLFSLFGDSIYVERIYSLITLLTSGWLITLIWKEINQDKKLIWAPLIFWLSTSKLLWATSNNLLENTQTVFVTLSVYFIFRSFKSKALFFIALAGIASFLGVMSKGLTGLFVWSLPILYSLIFSDLSVKKGIISTLWLVPITIVPLLALYFLNPSAQSFFDKYLELQLVNSLNAVQTVSSRFAILGMFFKNLLLPIGIGMIIKLSFKSYPNSKPVDWKNVLLFTLLSLAGVLPIMISLKQSNFYILSVFPFSALAIAFLFLENCIHLSNWLDRKLADTKLRAIAFSLILVALTIVAFQHKRVGRNHALISDVKSVITNVGTHKTIDICPDLRKNWSLHGYFMRYGHISINFTDFSNDYLLIENSCESVDLEEYEALNLSLKKFKLYQRINN